ncbi:tetratricopeptide repeat protein [candidate division WOR-3 bacterium]|nr:tetratricopeptide repeat protein [candidate division WOR-3 bacterium]
MAKKHGRVTKKELKKDKFVEEGARFFIWVVKHKIQLTWIIASILVISIGGGYFKYSTRIRQKKAKNEFSQALTAYRAARIEEAITRFEDLTRLYPKTKPGIKSIYWLANIYYFQGRYKEAREAYQRYLKKEKDEITLSGALLGIGDTYVQEEDYFSASQQYEEFVNSYPKSPLAPKALFKTIQCYQMLNQPDRIKSASQTLIKNYPNSLYARKAQGLIINLM